MARILFTPPPSEYLVPTDGSFRIRRAPTTPPAKKAGDDAKKDNKKQLKEHVERISELQERLYAADRHSVLLVFQAMDAAGKDGTIRALLSGINPAGCQVQSFKSPSSLELDHDFLWRISRALPERGRIGVFNRSHYEEVLAVRVHPSYVEAQNLPAPHASGAELWRQRHESINDFEKHLARNGTVILKFFLNVSREEQRLRLMARIDEADSNWKFDARDLRERALWPAYMKAFEDTLRSTSTPWAPWYAIPADDKPFMRVEVARIVRATLEGLKLKFPKVSPEQLAEMQRLREQLAAE
ncbi:MAG: polyphosphate kinase 2 family protein [Sandaracinaceae bacterium]|nr:polyphosphate kinase 2 family protein [Sandaracinaceae bacterium]